MIYISNKSDVPITVSGEIIDQDYVKLPDMEWDINAYQYDYFHQTLGTPFEYDGPREKIVDYMVSNGAWCVGTPDDLISKIQQLYELSGGFGGLMVQSTEWGTREQVKHSYELIARYVMPHFQNSLRNLKTSQKWSEEHAEELLSMREASIDKANSDYRNSQNS